MSHNSTIKNPLTIIAIFAGIAEISGTIVLPFVSPENQKYYIDFLIFFPTLLVIFFFLTLNFNHAVLYAPSDWKDEANFFRRFSPASTYEKERKLDDEVSEADQNAPSDSCQDMKDDDGIPPSSDSLDPSKKEPMDTADKDTNSGNSNEKNNRISLIKKYTTAEKLGLSKLESLTNLDFSRSIRFEPKNSPPIVFDGLSFSGNETHIAEVKYYKEIHSIRSSIDGMLSRFRIIFQEFEESGKKATLHFVLITDDDKDDRYFKEHLRMLYSRVSQYKLNFKIYHYNYNDLVEHE